MFKATKFQWEGDIPGILDIPSRKYNSRGHDIYKNLLESDGKCDISFLILYIDTYIDLETRAAQEDEILFKCMINNLSSEGKVKVYNHSREFTAGLDTSGILLLKVILDESGLQKKLNE